MKNEEISIKTKKHLSKTLKKLMLKKPLSKITISEIVRSADVNRKTFYYHFESINELFKWTLEEEAVHVVKNLDVKKDYKKAIEFVIEYIETNNDILNCAYDSMGREGLKEFFYDDFYEIAEKIVETIVEEMDEVVEDDFKDFLAKMYAGAIANMIIDYFSEKKNIDTQKIADYIMIFMGSSIKASIEAYVSEINEPYEKTLSL